MKIEYLRRRLVCRPGWWEWLNEYPAVRRTDASLSWVGRVSDPATIGRETAPMGSRDCTLPKASDLLVGRREHPQRVRRVLRDREQHVAAIRRPRLRDMGLSSGGLRQSLYTARAVDALDEDAGVSLAVGLERDTLAIGQPDRKSIPARQRQPPHGAVAFRDDGSKQWLRGRHRSPRPSALRRESREPGYTALVEPKAAWVFHRVRRPRAPRRQRSWRWVQARRPRSRLARSQSGRWRGSAQRASDALDDRNGAPRHFAPFDVERDGKDDAARRHRAGGRSEHSARPIRRAGSSSARRTSRTGRRHRPCPTSRAISQPFRRKQRARRRLEVCPVHGRSRPSLNVASRSGAPPLAAHRTTPSGPWPMMSPLVCHDMPQGCRAVHTVVAAPPRTFTRLMTPLV